MSDYFEDRPGNMVLRTVFFPPTLDDQLRVIAHRSKVSKGDLIRQLIDTGLSISLDSTGLALKQPAKGAKSTASKSAAGGRAAVASKASRTSSRSLIAKKSVAKKAATKKPAKRAARKLSKRT